MNDEELKINRKLLQEIAENKRKFKELSGKNFNKLFTSQLSP